MIPALILAASTIMSHGTDSLRDAITTRIAASPGAVVGLSFEDLQTGQKVSVNPDTVFHAASTMKIPVMIEVLRRVKQGAFSLDQEVLLVNQFSSIVDGSPYPMLKADDEDTALYALVGTRVPIRNLLKRMITRSSNLATNELIALVGAKNVTATAHAIGAQHTNVLRGVEDQKAFDAGLINITTAADLATMLLTIDRGTALSPEASAEMKEILLTQELNDKIPAGLPPGIPVAHKTGEITAVSHDAAVVYPPGRKPYVLVVMTRGLRESAQSTALISDISRIVYTHVMGTH
ncbi:MAG TPA: serine hydrolase [Gemmatimonadaceae bacterium]|nr:serine hydrolase [Gemmatimonadaceae bacterium]